MAAQYLHVVVAVIFDEDQRRVLISRRGNDVHQGGLWEFPGGKCESGESVEQALSRELLEELGIAVRDAQPLLKVYHDYPDKSVLLDVWQVNAYVGEAHGREGQPVEWVAREDLTQRCFPQANLAIINALRLSPYYMITPDDGADPADFMCQLEAVLGSGQVGMLQLRIKSLGDGDLLRCYQQVKKLAAQYKVDLLVNSAHRSLLDGGPGDASVGLHLTSADLMACERRPVPTSVWCAASCHNDEQLQHARHIGVDFVCLSPLHATTSHQGQAGMGWPGFSMLLEYAGVPVYALGGVAVCDLERVRLAGGFGVAGISSFWDGV